MMILSCIWGITWKKNCALMEPDSRISLLQDWTFLQINFLILFGHWKYVFHIRLIIVDFISIERTSCYFNCSIDANCNWRLYFIDFSIEVFIFVSITFSTTLETLSFIVIVRLSICDALKPLFRAKHLSHVKIKFLI